jgi:hypothetical protein
VIADFLSPRLILPPRFYYADQRLEDGTPMWDGPDAEGHAKHYLDLAEAEETRPWQQTFVVGQGYKKF